VEDGFTATISAAKFAAVVDRVLANRKPVDLNVEPARLSQ
jgi:hypothetical protein